MNTSLQRIKLNPYTEQAHINSLDGKTDEITVLEKVVGDPRGTYFIVDYKGVKCTAIFNTFVFAFYADDKYGVIQE